MMQGGAEIDARAYVMMPRAQLRAPLWRRLLAALRRKLTPACATCQRYDYIMSKWPKKLQRAFHEAHLYQTRVREQAEAELAAWNRARAELGLPPMPKPGDGAPRS